MELLRVFALVLGCSIFGLAQTANLCGTVYDPNGALVPGATVTAIDQMKNKYESRTNAEGIYEIGLPVRVSDPQAKDGQANILKFARYEITITGPGFGKMVFKDYMVVRSDRKMQLDTVLNVGPVRGPVFVNN